MLEAVCRKKEQPWDVFSDDLHHFLGVQLICPCIRRGHEPNRLMRGPATARQGRAGLLGWVHPCRKTHENENHATLSKSGHALPAVRLTENTMGNWDTIYGIRGYGMSRAYN